MTSHCNKTESTRKGSNERKRLDSNNIPAKSDAKKCRQNTTKKHNRRVHWSKNIHTYIPETCTNYFTYKSESRKEQKLRMGQENDAFVNFPCREAVNKSLSLLVDTGADSTLVKAEALAPNVQIDESNQKSLTGAFGGNIISKGTITARHASMGNFSLQMHVVPEGTKLPADGLLGRDIMWNRSVTDAIKKTIKFFKDKKEMISLPLIPERKPPQVYIAEQFSIKGRSQTIASVTVNSVSGDIVINKSEIFPGVFVGNTLTTVKAGIVFVPILNTNNRTISLGEKTHLSYDSYRDYRVEPLTTINTIKSGERSKREKLLLKTVPLSQSLNPEERISIENVLKTYNDVFQLPGDSLTHTTVLKHKIPTDASQPPINTRQYRLPEVHRNEVNRQVGQMLNDNVISPSNSPWNSPILLVPKKSGENEKKSGDWW